LERIYNDGKQDKAECCLKPEVNKIYYWSNGELFLSLVLRSSEMKTTTYLHEGCVG